MEILDENECNDNLFRLEIKIGKIQLYSLCFGVMCKISYQKKSSFLKLWILRCNGEIYVSLNWNIMECFIISQH